MASRRDVVRYENTTDEEEGGTTDSLEDLKGHMMMELEWPNTPLDPDTYGITICCIVRDFFLLAKQKGSRINRISRILTTAMLLGLCIGLQTFLLSQVKHFVSAKAVHDIRVAYDKYQQIMYNGRTYVLISDPITERRGFGGPTGPFFNSSAFALLGEEEQAAACRIPLSQPMFFCAVLWIWTLTCIAEVRKCKDLFQSLILETEATDDMSHALEDEDDEAGGPFVIARLTMSVKVILTLFCILPRLGITTYLIWIGCRWLLATDNFSDLILNAVALEFILCLKDVLYIAIVPRRSMLDLENTNIKPTQAKEPESMMVFVGTLTWAMIAFLWVVLYMGWSGHNGFQQVIRGFQWDVHEVCTSWIQQRYAV